MEALENGERSRRRRAVKQKSEAPGVQQGWEVIKQHRDLETETLSQG